MAPMKPNGPKPEDSWKWASSVEPSNVTLDHLLMAYRVAGYSFCNAKSRRNCKRNPYCYWGLGEKSWIKDDDEDSGDEDNGIRSEGEFAGLQNLGATCYLNSLLQLWYHNPIIRPAILKWKPKVDDILDNNYVPRCPVSQLQAMFARMKMSKKSKIDPTEFVSTLQLDTGEQQDAQEFSKLFMEVIIKYLSEYADKTIREMVLSAFRGELQNETECTKCKNKTRRQESFSELELNVRKKLQDSIDELLQDELLCGSDQYYCSVCQAKNDAYRRTQLLTLPPVLNLQLMRFVFDRESYRKKKVTTLIQFPEVLDMTSAVHREGNIGEPLIYHLTAVLIHNGPSASSGHYIARVKDLRSGVWLTFNDENVDKVNTTKSQKLVLKDDEEMDSDGEKRARKRKPGNHKSQGAYMLVYTLEKYVNNPEPDPQLWPYLENLVKREDELYEVDVLKSKSERDFENAMREQRKNEISLLYPDLFRSKANENYKNGYGPPPAKFFRSSAENDNGNGEGDHNGLNGAMDIDNVEFISVDWLQQWLDQNNPPPPVDNSMLTCQHGKLAPPDPNTLGCLYKIIPVYFADEIQTHYTFCEPSPNSLQRLRGRDALCDVCVKQQCSKLRELQKIEDNFKLFCDLNKKMEAETPQNSENHDEDIPKCWVSKEILRSWKRIARRDVELRYNNSKEEENDDVICDNGTKEDPRNSDILCIHGNLKPNDPNRKLISFEQWSIIEQHFKEDTLVLETEYKECEQCLTDNKISDSKKQEYKVRAAEEKACLLDLYHFKNRPTSTDNPLFLITNSFVEEWRKFIRNATKNDPPSEIANRYLLCQHHLLQFPVDIKLEIYGEDFSDTLTVLRESEWEYLKSAYSVDHEIKILPTDSDLLQYIPEPCKPCAMENYLLAMKLKFEYENEPIRIIRRVIDDDSTSDDENLFTPISFTPSSSSPPHPGLNSGEPSVSSKREKEPVDNWTPENNKVSVNSKPALDSQFLRRSARPKNHRNEKVYKVSSSTSIKDLKLMILKDFKALLSDQHLFYEDKELKDNTQTLGQLQIPINATIYLEIDTETKESDDPAPQRVETGFRGTLLLGSNQETSTQVSSSSPSLNQNGGN